ncbi:MAG: hypothetical protein CRN43_09870 [Candidatus Nephrothrix sp. EaCA]|nr:MAG: hypothetical protein CRN43_09870 [Candidatus Nephrothrix sp. EaCA]
MNIPLVPLIRKTGFRYGIMGGVVSSALCLAFVWLPISGNWKFMFPALPTLISIIAFTNVAFIFLAHLFFKNNNNGAMTFGQGVAISFWMGLASGTLISITTYITTFLLAAYIADMAVDMAEMLAPRQMMPLFMKIFVAVIYAVLIGLVVSLFTKKNPDAATF